MTTLASELKQVIVRRLDAAQPGELISIVSSLCNEPAPAPVQSFGIDPQWEVFDDVWALDRASGLYITRDYVLGGQRSWKASVDAAAKFNSNGWTCRAPTIRERLRMVDYTKRNPAFDKTIFRGDSGWEWTGTELVNEDGSPSGYAWGVGVDSGVSGWGDQANDGFVRAVRASQ